MKKLLVVMMILVSATVASAEERLNIQTGNDLVFYFKAWDRGINNAGTGDDNNNVRYLGGYMQGVIRTLGYADKVSIPPDTPYNQMIDVVKKLLNDHPEWWDYSSVLIIDIALARVWPPKQP